MKKWLSILALTFGSLAASQTVQPIVQPHVTYFDASGAACAGCSLYSYAAGTSTPLATYTSAAGNVQNTNPVVLDVSGSANIWVGSTAYKFILKDTSGTTLWTVDQVQGDLGIFCKLTGCTFTGPVTGTSSTWQTVLASVNGVINVAAPPYNAVGDCTGSGSNVACTNNHDAIQAAIDAAYASGASVLFPTSPTASGQTVYYTATAINPEGVSMFGPPGASGPLNSASNSLPVAIRGGAGHDIFDVVDAADPGFISPHPSFTVQDLSLIVDDSVDTSASFTGRRLGRRCDDVVTTSSSPIITSAAECEFQPGDVGQAITVGPLTTTVLSWQSANQVTLNANVVTGSTAVSTYISVWGLPVSTNVGNCAFAYDDYTAAFAGAHPNKVLFQNVVITPIDGSSKNSVCGFFFQGNQSPTWSRWENVYAAAIYPMIFATATGVEPSTSIWTGIADYNVFDHLYLNGNYPFLAYSGELQTIRDMQTSSMLMGPNIINAYGVVSTSDAWKIDIPETEPYAAGCTAAMVSFRIAGRNHQITRLSVPSCSSGGTIQWDASGSNVESLGANYVTNFNLTGDLNSFFYPVNSDHLTAMAFNITGKGNTFTTSLSDNPYLGLQAGRRQMDYKSASAFGSPDLSRSAKAFDRTHDFLNKGATNYYFNDEDLWLWPQEIGGVGTGNPVIVADAASVTASSILIPQSETSQYIGAANGTSFVIGKQFPAGKSRFYVSAKSASSASLRFTVQAYYSSTWNNIGCGGTWTVSTATYATYSCDLDATGLEGDQLRIVAVALSVNDIYVAWMGFTPDDTDLVATRVTIPGAPAGTVVAADGTGYAGTALTCSGTVGTPPWSCWDKELDGKINAFGVVAASTAGTNVTSGTITFPNTGGNAFTVTPELQVSLGDTPGGSDDAQTVYFTGLSTSGATVQIRCAVNIGGSGCSTYSNAVPIHWDAKGK